MSPYEISRRLQVEERAEFRRVLGLDNSSHRQAGKVSIALDILNTPDATDGDFRTASVVLLMCLFGAYYGVVLDQRQRCLWVLGMSNVHPDILSYRYLLIQYRNQAHTLDRVLILYGL